MKRFATLALVATASAQMSPLKETDFSKDHPSSYQYENKTQWVCGNYRAVNGGEEVNATVWQNENAGIVLLKENSLDHVRVAETAPNAKTFEELFCASYIRKYKNPNSPGQEGVCVRNAKSNTWDAILNADREAEETWALFATANGYQRTASKYKDAPLDGLDFQTQWGSGAEGPNPNNWCTSYMREMMCHVAFPQFAGNQTDLDIVTGDVHASGYQAPVRPVGRTKCESLFDNCNRHEPKPYKGNVSWLVGTPFIDADTALDNVLYCDAWNRGFGLAKAGCGVGAGDGADDEEFVATWDASSSLTPIGFLAVVATLLAALQ